MYCHLCFPTVERRFGAQHDRCSVLSSTRLFDSYLIFIYCMFHQKETMMLSNSSYSSKIRCSNIKYGYIVKVKNNIPVLKLNKEIVSKSRQGSNRRSKQWLRNNNSSSSCLPAGTVRFKPGRISLD